jgi:hypothetical protein
VRWKQNKCQRLRVEVGGTERTEGLREESISRKAGM